MTIHIPSARHYAPIAGSTMSYLDIGEGPVIVLGHSYLFDAEMWAPQIKALSGHYRLIVPEMWGHGDSGPMPAETASVADIAEHHLALLDQLGIDRFSLIGHSVGGMWAAELALKSPKRVISMALLNCYLGPEPDEARQRYMAMLAFAQASRCVPEEVKAAIIPLFFAPETIRDCPAFVTQFKAHLESVTPERITDSVVPLGQLIFNRRDAMKELETLRVPAMVLAGEFDLSRPPAEAKRMADALRCLFIKIPGAGHVSPLEQPDEVNSHLAAFLSHAGRRPASIIHGAPYP